MMEEQSISRIFDSFCKVCIRNEWISCLREQKKIEEREVSIDAASKRYPELFKIVDTYPSDSTVYKVRGIKILVQNTKLAAALNKLSEYNRNIILMSFFLEENCEEIAEYMGKCRSTISFQRKVYKNFANIRSNKIWGERIDY